MAEFDELNIKYETSELTEAEQQRLKFLNLEIKNLWLKEEVKAKQRSREKNIVEGDRNTSYFQAAANQRRRKTMIHQLEGPNGMVYEEDQIMDIASGFYKNLFKKDSREGFKLRDDFFKPEEKVTDAENSLLEAEFTEELKKAIMGSYSDGAPGPDGLSFMFYQNF